MPNKPLKINFGCGEDKLTGWVNLDKNKEYNPDVVWDLEQFPYPFESESAEEIMWKDVLEHISWRLVKKALKETYRILKKNGKVYIQCPDLEAIAKKIILNPNFSFDDLKGYEAISYWVYGRQDDPITGGLGGFHKTGFTIQTLRDLLQETGFTIEKIENDGGTNIVAIANKS